MTIERAIKRSNKFDNACVPAALDAALGSSDSGPHIPVRLYKEAESQIGLGVSSVIERVGGKIIDATDVWDWTRCISAKGINRMKLNSCSPLALKLNEDDISFASDLLKLDGLISQKKLYVAMQLALRAARHWGLSLGLDLIGGVNHLKLLELSTIDGILLFDNYQTTDGFVFDVVQLAVPGTYEDGDGFDFDKLTVRFFYYPLGKKSCSGSIFVFFNLDQDSELLEKGKP